MRPIITPSNAGFSARELDRREFQATVARAIDKHAEAIQKTREIMADLFIRTDELRAELAALRARIEALAQK